MITQLRVINFRSIQSPDLPLGKITVLTGANNSGKSSFIYAMLVLKNIVNNPNQSIDNFLTLPFINLGGFEETVFNKNKDLFIWLGATIKNKELEIDYEIRINPQSSVISLEIKKPFDQGYYIEIAFPYTANRNIEFPVIINGNQVKFKWNGFVAALPEELPVTNTIMSYLAPFQMPMKTFSEVDFVPIRRGFTKSFFSPVHLQTQISNEDEIATLISLEQDLAKKIGYYLEKIVDRNFSVYNIPGTASFNLKTKDKKTGFTSDLVNEGLGTNQLVTILAKILQPKNKFICIDEPEIHLHPTIIDKLVSVMIEIAEQDGKQFLLSTHSEHFITSLLNSVAKKEISNEDVKVYYLTKEGQETKAESQDINENGQIEGGLKNFYAAELDNLKTLFKITD